MLSNLFTPIKIGNITSKNRLLMSAMSINFGVDENCCVTDQLIQYFIERAKGGVGMMLVGGGSVHPLGQELPDLPQMYNDDCIPSLKYMVQKIKKYNTLFGVQLMHGGRQSYLEEKVGPSPIPAPAVVKGKVRELKISEIKNLVSCFGDSAKRCKESGFDFIEIHGAHGYLINQFLAPNSNIRTDEYGGSFNNRTRFLFEIIEDIKIKTGKEFPVGIRINGNDYIKNGWELKDTLKIAPLLEKTGIAYLHISGGVYGSTELTIPSMYTKHGCFVYLAKEVKKYVNIPVITVGRIKHPDHADEIIKQGKADIVSMGRSFLADPYYPEKAKNGKFSQIRPCIGCCVGCIDAVLNKEPGSCVVNPDVGREYKLKDKIIPDKLFKVLIAGGGPAGIAAARQFILQGHQVVICEKENHLGGLLSLASKAPYRDELNDILDFFKNEIKRLNIEVRYNTKLSLNLINEINPDKIVIATGSMPDMPIIKGLFQTKMDLVTNVDLISGKEQVKDKVIVLGGGMTGLITADFLADKGKQVVVLNRKKSFAEEMSSNDRYYLRERLKKGNVVLYKNVSIKQFTDDGVIFKIDKNKIILKKFDSIVLSEKQSSIRDAKKLENKTRAKFYLIGDAKSPRHLMYCINEAEEIARSI
ncbi:MAG: NADH:flavin oxidoreductase [Desulfobacteraceae bacterium 4572_130]|nr:MAG: NADH:flavin oxidoreductase [Desulfobacteraceae bacterium 4572_130]